MNESEFYSACPPDVPVLSVRHLSKSLSGRLILTDINFELNRGEIFGFVGPNGSGKTTTIKLILGLLHIDAGEIFICGKNVKTEFEAAIAPVGGIIENPEMYKYLTGRQNLMQYLRMYDDIPAERIDEVAEFVHLDSRIDDKVSKYSLGMRQRLGIAQAILHKPKLLILDEPTNGLDPTGIRELREALKTLAHENGVTVFISSHLLSEISLMCDRVGIIDRGMLVAVKSMEEIRRVGNDGLLVYQVLTDEVEKATEAIGAMKHFPAPDVSVPDISAPYAESGEQPEPAAIEYSLKNGKLYIKLEKREVPHVVKGLALADVAINGIVPVEHSLEDTFIEMTKTYKPGGEL